MIDKFMYGFLDRVYDLQDYTQLEINSKLIQKMEEVIENCNSAFEFVEWLKEEGVPNEVQTIIDTMLEDGTIDEIINQNLFNELKTELNNSINNFNSKLENITITMPPPSTIEENTKNLQDILDKAKDKNINLTVQFLGGHYELYTCIIYDNTTIKMTNNTELENLVTKFTNNITSQTKPNIDILFMNAKPVDSEDSNITGYNGRSNIVIDGGVINCRSAIAFCHGENITIKNVTFKNCKADHYIQIGACKNVKIKNCKFIGGTEKSSERQYVEYIQIDYMNSSAQPYWSSSANIYDHTMNEGIEIYDCEFRNGNGDYAFMYTAIGSHSSDGNLVNKDITIKNCKFTGYSHRALTINRMENVIIDNNIFVDTNSTMAIDISSSNNVNITSSNKITGGIRAIFSSKSSNIKIDGVLIEKIKADSDFIFIGECSNVELNKVRFIDCNSTNYNVAIRNSKYVSAYNCQDINTITGSGYFFKAYTKEEGINERITIKDTITDKKEVLISSANTIISSNEEVIWEGEITTGEIPLKDNLDKFKNLKIYMTFYGRFVKELNFVQNEAVVRDFNLADDPIESTIVKFIEIKLTSDTKKITVISNNQVNILNGTNTNVESDCIIHKITGERICY